LSVPTRLRVIDTAVSEHFAWCEAEGIARFLAQPIEAFDRFYGVILILDYAVNPPLSGLDPSPGLEEALAMLADGAASAFQHVSLQDDLTRMDGDLRNVQRLVERAEREAVLFELSRSAANALSEATDGLLDDLPELEEPVPEDEYRRRMARITVKLRRVRELIDEFRSLTSQSPARLRNVDLNDVIHAAAEEIRQGSGSAPATVSLRLQGDLPPLLLDPDKIREVLVALVEHGVSGTEERHATVSTRLQNEEAVVEVKVPDRSLPGGILESLFLPFAAADPGAPRHGLSLADQIVNEHGGQLRAKSEPGGGLLYWLSLPVGQNQDRRGRRADRRGRERRRDGLVD
jgi:two-component system sensor histidine kinase HydH